MAKEPNNAAKQNVPRLSAPSSPFATVLVGPEKKRFTVHQDLLTYHLEFFRAALTGKFKEAEEKTVPLPEDNEVIFEFFVHWMYHKEFPTKANASVELLEQWRVECAQDKPSYKHSGGGRKSENLISLHVFVDKYGVERLKTDTLNGLFMHLTQPGVGIPYQHSIRHAYEHLPDKFALLNLLVDIQCHIDAREWTKRGIEGYPSPFLVSVLERLTKHACDRLDVQELELCDYHEHKSEDERKACPHKEVVF